MEQQGQETGVGQEAGSEKMLGGITILMFVVAVITVMGIGIRFIAAGVTADQRADWWTEPLAGAMEFLLLGLIGIAILVTARILFLSHKVREQGNMYLSRILSATWDQEQAVRNMADQEQICDKIKELAFRSKNLDALRTSIDELLERHDFEGAQAAIDEAKALGMLGNDADKLQEAVEESKKAGMEERIEKQVGNVQSLLDKRDWVEANRESKRLLSNYPDHPRIKALPEKIKSARSAYKAHLLKLYGDAVRVEDVNKSYELLKELDKYLTPQEGEALKESARDVFKKRLHNLGVQFSIAIADSQWDTAIETGDEIMREYPNSRMGKEVKEKMPLLQQKKAAKGRQPLLSGQDEPPEGLMDEPQPASPPGGSAPAPADEPRPVPVKPPGEEPAPAEPPTDGPRPVSPPEPAPPADEGGAPKEPGGDAKN